MLSVSVVFVLLFLPAFVRAIKCLNESGDPVNWWSAISQGSGSMSYYYIDADSASSSFTLSSYDVGSSTGGAIMNTVNLLYEDSGDIAYALYNDEPPPDKTESSTYAHAKGVMMADDEGGYWLVHSKPHWPNGVEDGGGPFPDFDYAQSLLCVSVDLQTFDEIGEMLKISYPYIYDSALPDSLQSSLPSFGEFISKEKVDDESSVISFSDNAGGSNSDFLAFAKSKAWGKDLYEDLVAPQLKDDLYVETWRDGSGGKMPTFCVADADDWHAGGVDWNVYFVNNITMADGVNWSGTKDHSKWAVTEGSSESKWACVGDINRFCSQEARGGGTLCLQDDNLWNAFSEIVAGYDGCWETDVCAGSSQCYWC
ncbi:hypothetical protein TrVE_jg4962 [Triparma verrucosa]|uniref:Uncharacterized protein n=1 Tax=Triparma verrucosa TaxID=1606542 RepID=A0A9W7FK71_9STRA|nr:hypothetical protein TrVE_jg4962 [Triparma verrucosa]